MPTTSSLGLSYLVASVIGGSDCKGWLLTSVRLVDVLGWSTPPCESELKLNFRPGYGSAMINGQGGVVQGMPDVWA